MTDYSFPLTFTVKGARNARVARRVMELTLTELRSNLDYGLDDMPQGVDVEWPAPGRAQPATPEGST